MRVDTNFFGTVPMPDAGDPTCRTDRAPVRQRRRHRLLREHAPLVEDRRHARLRHRLADRAPLPARGLRGPAQPHHVRRPRRGADQGRALRADVQRGAAVAPAAPGRGLRAGRHRSPAAAWSSASVAAPSPARPGPSAPWWPPATTRCPPSTTASTARCSRSRWRSSSWPGTQERFDYRGKHFVFPPDDVPDRGTFVNDLTLIPKPRRSSTSTSRSPRRRRSSTCPGPGTRPSTGCRTPTRQKQKWDRYAAIREEVGRPVGPGRGPLPRAQPARRSDPGAGPRAGPARPRRVLQVPLPVRPLHQLPIPRRLEGAVRLPARPSRTRCA